MKPIVKQAKELKLGDVIKLNCQGYNTATVVKVTDTKVTITRPFIHTGDFEYTGGVLYYTGLETFEIFTSIDRGYKVVDEDLNIK
jgi:hypothetical protein